MTQIGILSDTHSYLDPRVFTYFKDCDQIWHAGDIGSAALADELMAFKPLKGVYGNIDGQELRRMFPLDHQFQCEELTVWITHIAGTPKRYPPRIREQLLIRQPDIFVCGHSHILKVARVPAFNNMLHINPGAAGRRGFHAIRTLIRLKIEHKRIFDFEVIELGGK